MTDRDISWARYLSKASFVALLFAVFDYAGLFLSGRGELNILGVVLIGVLYLVITVLLRETGLGSPETYLSD